jgi:hypothetical protein
LLWLSSKSATASLWLCGYFATHSIHQCQVPIVCQAGVSTMQLQRIMFQCCVIPPGWLGPQMHGELYSMCGRVELEPLLKCRARLTGCLSVCHTVQMEVEGEAEAARRWLGELEQHGAAKAVGGVAQPQSALLHACQWSLRGAPGATLQPGGPGGRPRVVCNQQRQAGCSCCKDYRAPSQGAVTLLQGNGDHRQDGCMKTQRDSFVHQALAEQRSCTIHIRSQMGRSPAIHVPRLGTACLFVQQRPMHLLLGC